MAKKPKTQFRHGPPAEVSYTPEQVAAHEMEMQILINSKNPFGSRTANVIVQPPSPQKPPQPTVNITAQGAQICWGNTSYPVNHNIAEWFKAMLEAKGVPVAATKHVSSPTRALEWLKSNAAPLRQLVAKGNGNSGYRLKTFD